ncbi:molybdotransferase-like divisome protein Glp [Microlunatus ginsengisoli]|uniref:Molybdopterin molybdenumtransferase n=1 Tax=Microlunatus ginsengisoli TaxID=363863 RepID=A0ABP7ATX8_9ACTN
MPLFGRRKTTEPEAPAPEAVPLPGAPVAGANGMRSVDDHRDYLLSMVAELPPFRQQLLDVIDLSICEDVVAGLNLPGFDNSAMDGYAVLAADVERASAGEPVVLPVVGEIAAGQAAPHPLAPGTAMKIMTGAPVPEGADAIVPYENTDRGDVDVTIVAASEYGQHIRRVGEDVAAGSVIYRAGDQLGPRDISLLAAMGIDAVMVRPRPRVVVISTGSELAEPGYLRESEHQIYDSNSFLLAAACRAAGAQVYRVGRVGDDPDAVKEVITDQLIRADLILTTGGVSQGDYDVIKQVMPELGRTDFAAVAMQPGKPQGFGLIGEDEVPIIMMPGNPVSAFVSFEVFVRPVLRKMMGSTPYVRTELHCRAAHAMPSIVGKRQFARGHVSVGEDGHRQVSLVGGHGSHLLGDLARANALVVLPEDTDLVGVGDEVSVWMLADHH